MSGKRDLKGRYFEDYSNGETFEFGGTTVSESEIIDFAEKFDPQYFHTDPDRAKESIFGGIVASGWHSTAIAMRMIVDHFASTTASMGSPGVDEVRWLKPVRPHDVLRLRVTIVEARPSRSKSDRGLVRYRAEMKNQRDEVVMTFVANYLVRNREAT